MYPVVIFTLIDTHTDAKYYGSLSNTEFNLNQAFGLGFEETSESKDYADLTLVEFSMWGLIKRALRLSNWCNSWGKTVEVEPRELAGRFGRWKFEAMLGHNDDEIIRQVLVRKAKRRNPIVQVKHSLEKGELDMDFGPSVG